MENKLLSIIFVLLALTLNLGCSKDEGNKYDDVYTAEVVRTNNVVEATIIKVHGKSSYSIGKDACVSINPIDFGTNRPNEGDIITFRVLTCVEADFIPAMYSSLFYVSIEPVTPFLL